MREIKLLHFADAHIGAVNVGPLDPETGLTARVMDFLRALDFVVETAQTHQVDLVLFAGDAFKNPFPNLTLQREWAKRILRLVEARIPVVLLVGNHDLSPMVQRAHTLELFRVFPVEWVRVVDAWTALGPEQLFDRPLYLIGLPWAHRATMSAWQPQAGRDPRTWQEAIEQALRAFWENVMARKPPDLPTVLLAHAWVPGAQTGSETRYSLDYQFTLPAWLVRDPRLDYVALGHVHRYQVVHDGHPLVVYAGSIERVDFGEAEEPKGCVLVRVAAGRAEHQFIPNPYARPFHTIYVRVRHPDQATEAVLQALEGQNLEGAMVRVVVEGPREVQQRLDVRKVERALQAALRFVLVRRLQDSARLRLPEGEKPLTQYTPIELLEMYWKSKGRTPQEYAALKALAEDIIREAEDQVRGSLL